MKHLSLSSVLCAAMLSQLILLAACHSNDDLSDITPALKAPAPMQVTIVFEPMQLGAMITNDYLLMDVETTANGHKDSLSSNFICMSNYAETREALKEWAAMVYGADKRQHRLLILTDPALASLMEGLQLQETDHLLMLKTWLDDAKQVGPPGRTHVLNVSCANAVKRAVERRHDAYMEEYADRLDSIENIEYGPFEIVRLNEINYADSINETLKEMFPEKGWDGDDPFGINVIVSNFSEQPDVSDINEYVYLFAYIMWFDPIRNNGKTLRQPIQFVDWGSFNRTYEWYWITHRESPWRPQSFIIGEPGNSNEPLDYIIPKYDLASWINRWMAHPDNMPEEEWGSPAKLDLWEERY